ncbi:hypothetical protein [Ignicoccus hospitalis]|uniref:Uncharacterized protein n=1 Tax=Ignicoccus hospitalis (strain KIN4/I / DSM 18386 / JCM 14125) TaxID=453591 RepID=A8A8Y2_IGNH4|nr:hypothetical protein [Ignicoccus hospitalis]ABU81384.1 hypothetical protein Igni_0200 [Ignicoccus hospitalis KIN4/I]HIH90310.1 hypothetical protein [Desulfurococcaceae archaeon]
MRRSAALKGLTLFEISIILLSLIATLAWVYMVYKITTLIDTLQTNLNAMFGGA